MNSENEKFVTITREEMDEFFFAPQKGWIRNISGYEYVYDYHLKSPYPLLLKVMSSIQVDSNTSRNKGSDAIRVFVVLKENCDIDSKIVRGFFKAKRIYRTQNWRDNLKILVIKTHIEARKYYDNKFSRVK